MPGDEIAEHLCVRRAGICKWITREKMPAHKLPEPEFEVHGRTFRAVFKPGTVAGEAPEVAGLNDRQKMALEHMRIRGRITRAAYEKLAGIPPLRLSL